jgi:glycosyltransferase involved in cell wall biosynthesis
MPAGTGNAPPSITRIALLVPTLDRIAGAERQLLLLASGLANLGYAVTVVTLSGTAVSHRAMLAGAGIELLCLEMHKAWVDPRGWLRFLRWHRRKQPHILHAHLPHAIFFARCIRLLAPVRLIIDTVHTTAAGSAIQQWLFRRTAFLSDQTTAVGNAVRQTLLNHNLAHPDRVTVLPNAVAIPPDPSPRSPDRPLFTWLAAGRLVPLKDYPTLLRAFALLPKHARLVIAGSGPEIDSLHRLATVLGIADRLHFCGFVDPVDDLYRTADAFVQSSLWEGLPTAPIEAAAHGLPVVATDAPGTAETLVPDKSGLLVPVGNAQLLAQAMQAIMALSAAQRQAMGSVGRPFVQQHFALPVILSRWASLYTALLVDRTLPSRCAKPSAQG